MTPNFFEPAWVAPRYAAARPDVHPAIARFLREVLPETDRRAAMVDVGCGTGMSTRSLGALAERAIGIDPSLPMLREAIRRGGAGYARGRAEALPLPDACVELATIGCAWHWCDPDAFLAEARRVLSPDGHLAVYDSYIRGDATGRSDLFDWLNAEYWEHLPRVPRNPLPEVGSFDHPSFELVASRPLETWVPMSREMLLVYLTTQSGAVAAVESGERTLGEIESMLRAGLSERFPAEGGDILFRGPVWVVRRRS